MNYFLATASYEHFLLQYLEYGFSLFKSLPHQIQQRYKGLISFFFIKISYFSNIFSSIILLSKNSFNFLRPSSNNSICFSEVSRKSLRVSCKEISLSNPQSLHFINFGSFIYLMTKFTNNWRFQHLLDRPTSSYTVFKKSTLKSFFSRPLSKGFGFAFISKQMVIRAIKLLISLGIPFAILWSIITFGISPVNRSIFLAILFAMFIITFAHIFQKITKIKPLITNFYSSSSISFITTMFNVITSLFHRTPNMVYASSGLSVFHSSNIANRNINVNSIYTPVWITKSQLTDFYNKVKK